MPCNAMRPVWARAIEAMCDTYEILYLHRYRSTLTKSVHQRVSFAAILVDLAKEPSQISVLLGVVRNKNPKTNTCVPRR